MLINYTVDGHINEAGLENRESASPSIKMTTGVCQDRTYSMTENDKESEVDGNENDFGVTDTNMRDSTEGSVVVEDYEWGEMNKTTIDTNDVNDEEDEDTVGIDEDPYRLQMGICITESGAYQCDVCLVEFPSYRDVMLHHSISHTSKKHFPCQECGKSFAYKEYWRSHNIREHSKFDKKSAQHASQMGIDVTKSGTYKCDVCLNIFPSFNDIQKHHMSEHTVKKHFPCPECDRVFKCKKSWRYHNKTIHMKFGIRSAKKKVKCTTKSTFGIGLADSGTYKCDVCLKDFPTHRKAMQHHKSEHTNKKHFPCPECSRVSPTNRVGSIIIKAYIIRSAGINGVVNFYCVTLILAFISVMFAWTNFLRLKKRDTTTIQSISVEDISHV